MPAPGRAGNVRAAPVAGEQDPAHRPLPRRWVRVTGRSRHRSGPLPRLLRFAVLHIPGVDLVLRGFDFFVSDLLHHYMETGMLAGIKARAEGKYAHASNADPAAPAVEPVAATY